MKKIVLASLLLTLALCGCSSNEESTKAESTTTSTETTETTESTDSSEQETQTEEEAYNAFVEKLYTEGTEFPQLEEVKAGEEIVVMTTNKGEIKIKLCADEAPKAVENFKALVKAGCYDGIIFHRVIDGFMIQGGDPTGTGRGGESIWGGKFADEFSGDMYHFRGALCYANSGSNTNGSQFYIVNANTVQHGYFEQIDQIIDEYGSGLLSNAETGKIIRTNYSEEARELYNEMGGTPALDFGYTIFGYVFEGMDVVDAIAAVEVKASDSGEFSSPVEEVRIEKAVLVEY